MKRLESLHLAIARARSDERGFSMIEMMVASLVLFIVVTSITYTTTVAFKYAARGRQKQDATAAANQALEQATALTRATVESGMLTSDLSTNDSGTITSGCGGHCYTVPDGTSETVVE